MTTFSQAEKRLPPANVVVGVEAFRSSWDDAPKTQVCIGLRLIADVDIEDARIEAAKRAGGLFPDHARSEETAELWVSSFKDAFMRWIVARGTCDPNDVTQPWEGWAAAPEDMTRDVLTDVGVQALFDAWERMRLSVDIGVPLATEEDLALLPALLRRLPALDRIDRPRSMRLRRLMRFVLEELERAPDDHEAAAIAATTTEPAETRVKVTITPLE